MADKLNIRVNLSKLNKSAVLMLQGKAGPVKCVVIPVEENNLYIGDKGAYLDVTAIPLTNPKYAETHLLKPSLPKEKYQALTEEQRNAIPIIGGVTPFKTAEPEGNAAAAAEYGGTNSAVATPVAPFGTSEDDLPF